MTVAGALAPAPDAAFMPAELRAPRRGTCSVAVCSPAGLPPGEGAMIITHQPVKRYCSGPENSCPLRGQRRSLRLCTKVAALAEHRHPTRRSHAEALASATLNHPGRFSASRGFNDSTADRRS